ncbi:hypothetical protein ASC94_26565 [Massilia sp. Root418]|jgi:hypothetical protein|nr:hypothetical protein ASC94_26565 [Massilia sp. Root418]
MLTRRLDCEIDDSQKVVMRFYDPRILLGLPSALDAHFAPVSAYQTAITQIHAEVARNAKASVREFDRLVEHVLSFCDTGCIAPLLLCLDDRFEAHEAMFSIIHAAESFADEPYIQACLAARPGVIVDAPEWADILLRRIQNNDDSRAVLESLLAKDYAQQNRNAAPCDKQQALLQKA